MYEEACPTCHKIFYKREHLERHIRVHSREKPFACSSCSRAFSRRDTLLRHSRIHSSSTDQATPTIASGTAADACDQATTITDSECGTWMPDHNDHLLELPLSQENPDSSTISVAELGWPFDEPAWLEPDFQFDDILTYHLDTSDLFAVQAGILSEQQEPVNQSIRTPDSTHASNRSVSRAEKSIQSGPYLAFDVSGKWFSSIDHELIDGPTASGTHDSNLTIDEGEHEHTRIASSLKQSVPEFSLPSTSFLNRCIERYFTKVWPLVPVVHPSTFRPSTTEPLLLLSICSIGALFDGSPNAVRHALQIYDGIRRAISASYDTRNLRTSECPLPFLQVAMIGQTFAFCSPSQSHAHAAQAFHGTLVVTARHISKLLAARKLDSASEDSPRSRLVNRQIEQHVSTLGPWISWVKEQTLLRILNVLQIHDGELAALLHEAPLVRFGKLDSFKADTDQLFLARTESQWQELRAQALSSPITANSSEPKAHISAAASLEALLSHICDWDRRAKRSSDEVTAIMHQLCDWSSDSTSSIMEAGQGPSLRILWHSCWLYLLVDLDMTEKICGRDGLSMSKQSIEVLGSNGLVLNYWRATAHAICISIHLERLKMADVPAIYVPRAAFQAALTLIICLMTDRPQANVQKSGPHLEGCTEFEQLRDAGVLSDKDYISLGIEQSGDRYLAFAHSITSVLRTIRPWGDAGRLVTVLDEVIAQLGK